MNYQRLDSRICLDEGFRAEPYLDTVGVATIGYGTTRIFGSPVTLSDESISEANAREVMRAELFLSCMDAQSLFTRFDDMNHVRQEVLVNMAYNLGKTRLSGFVKMIEAAETLSYFDMAIQMKDSKWFRQVGQRSMRLYYAMLNGEW